MAQYQSIYNGSQIDDCVSQAVRMVVQQLTDAQKSQARTNIGAGTSSFSGSYNDLSDKPTIPTKTSQLTNDSGFLTSLEDCFRYQGFVTDDYVTGTTYSTITNGSYKRLSSESTDSLLHFQIGGSASGLDIRFSYPQGYADPLQYRKCVDSNRFAGGWVTLIDSLNIGSYLGGYLPLSGGGIYNTTNNDAVFEVGSVYGTNITTMRCCYGSGYGMFIASKTTSPNYYILHCCNSITGIGGESAESKFIVRCDGNVGIGIESPSYKLHVTGTVGATGFTNTSDIRNKNIVGNVNLKIKDIADAPIFKFTWLDKEMEQGANVGTSAQYWNIVLPEIVTEANDEKRTLSMQYDVAGLVSSVILARKIVEQEETIKLQDTRIKELEKIVDDIQKELGKQKL